MKRIEDKWKKIMAKNNEKLQRIYENLCLKMDTIKRLN